jgi:hypothetical protein
VSAFFVDRLNKTRFRCPISGALGLMEAATGQPHPSHTRQFEIAQGCQWAADLFLLSLQLSDIDSERVDELIGRHQEMIDFGLIDPEMDLRAYTTGRVSAARRTRAHETVRLS